MSIESKKVETNKEPIKEKKIYDRKNKSGRTRTPSVYNLFMKKRLAEIKSENTKLTHREAFSQAAKDWNKSKNEQNDGEQ